jgi:hypothetical protein
MNFETLKSNIVTILGNAAAGRYRVVGYQTVARDVDEFKDSDRLVKVYFSEDQFPKNQSALVGNISSEPVFMVELIVSKSAKGDLATLENPASTPAQLQTALANVKLAEDEADTSWDELAGIVYQVLMDANNIDFDLPKGTIASRWLDNFKKDEPGQIGITTGILGGKLILVTGSARFTCVLDESIVGDTGTAGDTIDTALDIVDDDNEKTGVQIGITPAP